MSVPNAPQAHDQTSHTCYHSYQIGTAITCQSFRTFPFSTWLQDAVVVVYHSVEKVEDIPTDDRAERHETPVRTEAINTESLCYERWKAAKEEAIA